MIAHPETKTEIIASLLTRPDIVLRGEESLDDGLLLGGGGGAAAAVELPVQQRDDPLHRATSW